MEENTPMHIESRESMSLRVLFLLLNRLNAMSALLSIAIFDAIFLRMMAPVKFVVLRVGIWNCGLLECSPFGVDDFLWMADLCSHRVVDVSMLMFSREM
jgi:hypothetical protein